MGMSTPTGERSERIMKIRKAWPRLQVIIDVLGRVANFSYQLSLVLVESLGVCFLHSFEEADNLMGAFSAMCGEDFEVSIHTGFTYHLVPPNSNQLRWPPVEVQHRTTKGFCCTSAYGTASLSVI